MYSLTPSNPEVCCLQNRNKFGKQFDRIIIWAGSSSVIVLGTEEAFAGMQQWFFPFQSGSTSSSNNFTLGNIISEDGLLSPNNFPHLPNLLHVYTTDGDTSISLNTLKTQDFKY